MINNGESEQLEILNKNIDYDINDCQDQKYAIYKNLIKFILLCFCLIIIIIPHKKQSIKSSIVKNPQKSSDDNIPKQEKIPTQKLPEQKPEEKPEQKPEQKPET